MNWRDIVNLSDGDLINKGVAALGARRKMLKVFEQVRKEMLLQVRTTTYFSFRTTFLLNRCRFRTS